MKANKFIKQLKKIHKANESSKQYDYLTEEFTVHYDHDIVSDLNLSGFSPSAPTIGGVIFSKCNFLNANLECATFNYVEFDSCDFTDASFGDAKFIDCKFNDCTGLKSVDYTGASFIGTLLPFRFMSLTIGSETSNPFDWRVTITPQRTIIGCQDHLNEQWLKMTTDEITQLSECSTYFHSEFKSIIIPAVKWAMKCPNWEKLN